MLVALALLGLSLSHLASGVAIVTGSGERDGWLMAIGIDMGFVALELALLVAPATARPGIARYASTRDRWHLGDLGGLPSPRTRKA